MDGVIEAHTGWQIDEYADVPGYHGTPVFNDPDKMIELITAADAEGLAVHVHSVGNDATQFMMNFIEEAEKITGDMDQRNVLAPLQFVTDEDIQRMAKTRSILAVRRFGRRMNQKFMNRKSDTSARRWRIRLTRLSLSTTRAQT